MPEARAYRAYSRDPATIAALGPAFTASGYRLEVRVAMVQAFFDFASPLGGEYQVGSVQDALSWSAFEESIWEEDREHGRTPAMTEQFIRLCHWRAGNTPHRFFIATEEDRALGRLGLFQHGATAYLHGLYIRPAARRRGVGAALTRGMTAEMRAMGADRLTLECSDDGYLPGYYTRLGFRPVGQQHVWTRQS